MSDTSQRERRYRRISQFHEVGEVLSQVIPKIRVKLGSLSVRTRSAVGRILAEDVHAPRNLPPFHTSHVDGFAVRSFDIQAASEDSPVGLAVVGSIRPGELGGRVGAGQALRIFTGGYLPEGADTVIPQEDVLARGEVVYVTRPYAPFENVVPSGSDVKCGQLVAKKGEVLAATKASLLETLGVYSVHIRDAARVSILSFGDELTDEPEEVERGKILNTHAVIVAEMVRALGGDVTRTLIVADTPEAVSDAISKSVEGSHCILTIGGSSVGDIDLVGMELRRHAELFIQGLKLQPGRVGGVAVVGGKPVVMLPGLIHSTVNVFNYLAAPILAHVLETSLNQLVLEVEAFMTEPVELQRWIDFKRIVWVTLKARGDGKYEACPNVADASSISSISKSHGFIEVPPGKSLISPGEKVSVMIPLWVTRSVAETT